MLEELVCELKRHRSPLIPTSEFKLIDGLGSAILILVKDLEGKIRYTDHENEVRKTGRGDGLKPVRDHIAERGRLREQEFYDNLLEPQTLIPASRSVGLAILVRYRNIKEVEILTCLWRNKRSLKGVPLSPPNAFAFSAV